MSKRINRRSNEARKTDLRLIFEPSTYVVENIRGIFHEAAFLAVLSCTSEYSAMIRSLKSEISCCTPNKNRIFQREKEKKQSTVIDALLNSPFAYVFNFI